MSSDSVTDPAVSSTASLFRQLFARGGLDLALPGGGNTDERLRQLCGIARRYPLGVARLSEAHTDAVAILAEAGRVPDPGATYGVWASEQPQAIVRWDETSGTISGRKPFGTGVGIIDRALVTAEDDNGTKLLIDVDVGVDTTTAATIQPLTIGWATSALSDTATAPIVFDQHPVEADDIVAKDDWYLSRPGFWHGACAPAACWAGAAIALVDTATLLVDDDPHRRAQHGALVAHRWSLEALLRSAGTEIDDAPADAAAGEHRARALRQIVERSCTDVLDRFGRAFGPRPYTSDVDVSHRAHDLHLYLRQHHGERELPALSALVT